LGLLGTFFKKNILNFERTHVQVLLDTYLEVHCLISAGC
jgi:hypothetical protein